MKILHLLHQYLPEKIGGTELYTRTLARMQAAAGHDAAIFAPSVAEQSWPEPSIEEGVQVYRFPLGERGPTAVFQHTFRQPAIQEAFTHLLERTQPDLIHIQHLMGLPAALINPITAHNIPYVLTLHDYYYICANAQLITNYDQTICSGPNWWLNCARCALARAGTADLAPLRPAVAPIMALRNLRLKAALDQAARLIAPTHFVRATYHQLGVDSEKITVVPHGIHLPETLPPRRKGKPGQLRVAYIGGLAPQKGVHILIDAVNRLDTADIHLNIYGDPTAFPDYVAELQARIRQPNIQLNGRLPHEKLWQTLAQTDLVVVPSLWYETASLIIQEAFAAGVPVLASDIGALKERIRDGVDGLRFPPGDSAVLSAHLHDLHQHPKKLAQLAAAIQPVFTIHQHHQAIQNIYQTIQTNED